MTTGRTDVEHRPDLERAIPEADEDTQAPPRSHAAEGQRRQLAVLVFDLVDSTPLAIGWISMTSANSCWPFKGLPQQSWRR